jgi:hypothetical protein
LDVIADPSTVIKPAKISVKLLRERHQVRREFRWLLCVCSILKYFVISGTIALGASTASYQFFFAEAWLWQLLLKVTGGLSPWLALLFAGTYAVLVARVDGVIEKSKPAAAQTGGRSEMMLFLDERRGFRYRRGVTHDATARRAG